jgi:hypothetical protein
LFLVLAVRYDRLSQFEGWWVVVKSEVVVEEGKACPLSMLVDGEGV